MWDTFWGEGGVRKEFKSDGDYKNFIVEMVEVLEREEHVAPSYLGFITLTCTNTRVT